MDELVCPLCLDGRIQNFFQNKQRKFLKCLCCQLIFVPVSYHLTPAAERARYETHENNPEDLAYRKFLSRLLDPLVDQLQPGQKGLDFGSGPGPTVSRMMRDLGFLMEDYDPYFAPRLDLLKQKYDFITCTETVEHLQQPGQTWALLDRLLNVGGYLGVMTQWIEDDQKFPDWYYHRDPTHLCFYRRQTLNWIAFNFGWQVKYPRTNVALFQKKSDFHFTVPAPISF